LCHNCFSVIGYPFLFLFVVIRVLCFLGHLRKESVQGLLSAVPQNLPVARPTGSKTTGKEDDLILRFYFLSPQSYRCFPPSTHHEHPATAPRKKETCPPPPPSPTSTRTPPTTRRRRPREGAAEAGGEADSPPNGTTWTAAASISTCWRSTYWRTSTPGDSTSGE
jgi:hypothetical protein